VSNTKLRTAIKDALKAQVDQQVKDGLLTKAEGDTLKARIDSGSVGVEVGPSGAGFGDLGVLDAAAAYLGVGLADIRTAFAAGKSLSALAGEKNKSVSGLQDAIVAKATAQLAAAVTAGDLTDAQRDTILTRVKNTVAELIAQTGGRLGERHGPKGMVGNGLLRPGNALHRR
jgi:hypothetical protein